MSKKGMNRIDRTHTQPKNQVAPVPELQGKAKLTKEKARPIIAGTQPPSQKVYHTVPFSAETPISQAYSEIDTDLARDNLENDMPYADLQSM